MTNKRSDIFPRRGGASGTLFGVFAAVLLLSIFTGIATGWYFLALLPALLLIIFLGIVDLRAVFFLLLFCIPLSTEVYLPNGFGTDLPTEPLMVALMAAYLLFLLKNGRQLDGRFFRHPLSLLLFLHFGWIVVTTITSSAPFVSFKFLLAKSWYISTFYFLAGLLLRTERDLRQFFWTLLLALSFTIIVILARHSASGFSFASVHQILNPFYRNHVAYASLMVVFFPFIWFFRQLYKRGDRRRRVITFFIPVFLVAIYLSYTRAAYVALFIASAAFPVIHWKLTRYVLAVALIAVFTSAGIFAYNNRYLDFAPNYERTVTHRNFEHLLEATYQGEDISTMERVYRWIAGLHMSKHKPIFGFGPGNFSNFYKSYTVRSFQTYVSDNPEQSGIHSYYLMILAEQGYPGLFFFVLLASFTLLKGEAVYHSLRGARQRKTAMMALLSTIVILSLLIINDLLETDKIGPFFFMNLALLVNLDLKAKKGEHD